VYSSPLLRAQETAQRIALAHRLTVRTVAEITEADVGAWERRSWVEIRETETDAYEKFQRDPATHGYRQGENLAQVRDRVVPAIDAIMRSHLGERIAIIGHNVVNRVYLAEAIHLPLARARGIAQENCGINLLRFRDEQAKVITINSVFHLE
jgi:broad specificity phosphatase PhoE